MSLKKIDDLAFWGCSDLKEIILPKTLEEIDGKVFGYCKSLEKVVLNATHCNTSQVDCVFEGCGNITEFVIAEGVEYIPHKFCMKGNMKTIKLPSTVVEIGIQAFYECPELTELVIPSSVKKIGDYCIGRNNKIEKLIIPSNIEEFGDCAVIDMENLKELHFEPSNIKNSYHYFVRDVPNCKIYIPKGSRANYELPLQRVIEAVVEE